MFAFHAGHPNALLATALALFAASTPNPALASNCVTAFSRLASSPSTRAPGQDLIRRAIIFAKERHSGQFRKNDGLPYVVHPVRVSKTVKRFTDDPEILAAGYLHDTVEDTNTSIEEIKKLFGSRVARIVEELTSDEETIRRIGKAQYLLEKMSSMSDEALLIKLSDRLDNVSDFDRASKSFVARYSAETNFILNGLKRDFTPAQKELIRQIRLKIAVGSDLAQEKRLNH